MVEPPAEMICVRISCDDITTTPYASWRKAQTHYLNVICSENMYVPTFFSNMGSQKNVRTDRSFSNGGQLYRRLVVQRNFGIQSETRY
jgi:hypothetical protein